MFSLSIAFGVVSKCKVEVHVECLSKGLEEGRHELGALVGNYMQRDTMPGKMWSTNSLARRGAVIVLMVGIKIDCFKSWSTTMRIVS